MFLQDLNNQNGKVYKRKNDIMVNKLVIRKCLKCGALVEIIKDCKCDNCEIKCCGEQMG